MIGPEEASQKMAEGWAYIDVRSIPEFEAGHPQGAYNVPLLHKGKMGMEPNPEFLKVMEANFEKNAKLIVACKMGGRSAKAASVLSQAGYTELLDQSAGYLGKPDPFGRTAEAGWKQKDLPVDMTPEAGKSYEDLHAKAG